MISCGKREAHVVLMLTLSSWLCFSLGRPSAFPEAEMDVPLPTDEKLLQAVVTLARVMSKSVARIYRRSPHDSLLPLWNAANDIRRELRLFAERQREVFNFGDSKGPHAGELGVCQTIVSTCKCRARAPSLQGQEVFLEYILTRYHFQCIITHSSSHSALSSSSAPSYARRTLPATRVRLYGWIRRASIASTQHGTP